jgi:hypothetical protein
VSAAYNSYDVDTNWYTDTGASDHITSNLEKLSVRDKYKVSVRNVVPTLTSNERQGLSLNGRC